MKENYRSISLMNNTDANILYKILEEKKRSVTMLQSTDPKKLGNKEGSREDV